MSAVLKRLQNDILRGMVVIENGYWKFDSQLEQQSQAYFEPLLDDHLSLKYEYDGARIQLKAAERSGLSKQEIKNQIIAALIIAETLENIFRNYISVDREVGLLRADIELYRELLSAENIHFTPLPSYLPKPAAITRNIRDKAIFLNWIRLMAVRAWRILANLANLIRNSPLFVKIIETIGKYVNPFFSYLAWIFFIPRSLANLFVLFKHVIAGSWLPEKERKLSFWQRLDIQLQRRGFELGNDIVWGIGNALACLLLLGLLAMVGTYLSVVLFFYDVFLAAVRGALGLYMLHKLKKIYENLKLSPDESKEAEQFKDDLKKRIGIDQKKLIVSFASLLALAVVVLAAAIVFQPLMPVISAALLFAITVLTYVVNELLEKQRPKSAVSRDSLKHCFTLFKPAKKEQATEMQELNLPRETLSFA